MKLKRKPRKKYYDILKKVRQLAPEMEALTDEELSGLTKQFKERYAKGESLNKLLPEAYAAMCEADKRVLGKAPYDVQVLGAIALHEGKLAEMNTGEGKTLVATLPLYLNAITEKSCFLLTANPYLARRDAEEMGQVYRFMGLTIGVRDEEDSKQPLTTEEKQAIYKSDIVYTTHALLGFDYLFDNLVKKKEDHFVPDLYYAIIDEADSVLLDAAQVPLVISGAPRCQSNLYEMTDFFVTTLNPETDYEIEDGHVWLTEDGIDYAERYFSIDNFYARDTFEVNRHVTLALRAHKTLIKEDDYLVNQNNELILLDRDTGRMLRGVKLRGGVHQALETKEKVELTQETRSIASITYQALFQLFEKMAGMSGTIADASRELRKVYKTKTVVIPPNHPLQRVDHQDTYFQNRDEQYTAAVKEIVRIHETGQPVLVIASNILETEMISERLVDEKIPHSVLNAINTAWEAQIIAEAGQRDAVTVATSMAGRGTDIVLGEGIAELGGLAVIGIGRMYNHRLERQARGRAGRQGDPGMSKFFVSLEDDVVKKHGPKNLVEYIEDGLPIRRRKLKRIINSSRKVSQEMGEGSRKSSFDYDKVMQKQRNLIYEVRNELLEGNTLEKSSFYKIAENNVKEFINTEKQLASADITRFILDNVSYRLRDSKDTLPSGNKKEVKSYLEKRIADAYEDKRRLLQDQALFDNFVRHVTLLSIDEAWVEQVDYLQQLRGVVSGRSFAQRNVLLEYQVEGFKSYKKMIKTIHRNIMRNILLSTVSVNNGELDIVVP